MAAFKNKANGTWYVQFRYTDWKGERQQKLKRGFATKKEAQAWEREFLMQKQADVNMTFESFAQLYEKDMKPKLKLNTWLTKESIIQKKILPYFGKRKLSEITAKDVMDWQNAIRGLTDAKGKPYSPTYLKTVHNQLSALFNHAVRYYGLQVNPAAKAGNMGVEERREMLFWTKDEYLKFADAMMDKPLSYYAFEMLYWCGIREGELLALTPTDFDFEAGTVSINKSYQRLKGKDVITTPKTKKSKSFLMAQLAYHVSMGLPLWDYPVHKGTVLYLALEDDHRRLQERLYRMFGMDGTNDLLFSICAKQVGAGLEEQLKRFVQEHPDTKLIIIDTLQKIREAGGDKYSYANDYEVVGKLKHLADACGVF